MLNLIKEFVNDLPRREEGQTFVEYGLILGGISILILAAFTPMITAFTGLVTKVVGKLNGT